LKQTSILLILLISIANIALSKNNDAIIINANINTPIVISLQNKYDNGEWQIESKPGGLNLETNRKGQLYTYFVFKATNEIKGTLIFNYIKDNEKIDIRTYIINIKGKEETIPNSKEDKALVIIPKEKEKDETKMSDKYTIKKYISELIESGLVLKAKQELDKIVESQKYDVEKEWIIKQKILIMEKTEDYNGVINYINELMGEEENNDIKNLELFLRLKRAKAYAKTGKNFEAESELVYLKNFYPDAPDVYYQLGLFYLNENRIDKCISLFENLVRKFNEFEQKEFVYITLARHYYKVVGLNGYNLSYEYYKKIKDLGPVSIYYNEAIKMIKFLEENFLNIR